MKIDGVDLSRRLVRRPDGDSIEQDENGALRAMATFTCDWKRALSLMPRRWQSRHPDFPNLICERVSVAKDKTMAVITAEYVGGTNSSGSFGSNSNVDNAPVVTVTASVSQEPIETHPDFTSTLGGTSETPLNGAVFDDDGAFVKFGEKDDGTRSSLYGVTSYHAPRIVVRETRISTTQPSNVQVGTLESAPYGQGQFLKVAHTFTRQGAVYIEEKEWMGPARGSSWNSLIYD